MQRATALEKRDWCNAWPYAVAASHGTRRLGVGKALNAALAQRSGYRSGVGVATGNANVAPGDGDGPAGGVSVPAGDVGLGEGDGDGVGLGVGVGMMFTQ